MEDYYDETTLDNKEPTPFWTPMKTVGALWAGAVTGSFAYQFRNPNLLLSQKVVQARVAAQGITVAALIASAAIAVIYEDKVVKTDNK